MGICVNNCDTIFALSSGRPPAAIAVVRISGSGVEDVLAALCGRMPPARVVKLRQLRRPQCGDVLDSALVLWFPGPHTATGEDLAELHLHGGRAVVAAVLDTLAAFPGLRPAQAGEFTRRALENGRIDLAEAEGLADLLSAETDAQRRNALNFAMGHFSAQIAAWQEAILQLSAQIEAELDFGDEDDVARSSSSAAQFATQATAQRTAMEQMLAIPPAERLKDGISIAIAGPPNAGKSTLFNALVQREAAITSPVAGTTRDVIEASVAIKGIAFRLLDTAGLHDSSADQIEIIGMERAQNALAVANIVLWLGDPANAPSHPRLLRIAAQSDVRTNVPGWAEQSAAADYILSAHSGAGMAEFRAALVKQAQSLLPATSETALNVRQRGLIAEAVTALADDPEDKGDLILLAERLRHARSIIDQITGRAGTEDMLDALFGRFCIGK
jgi:tRNA modification GTPase